MGLKNMWSSNIRNVQELLKAISEIKDELEGIKKDIAEIQTCTINEDEKIIGIFNTFATSHGSTWTAKKEYQNMYDAANAGDNNIITTIDSLNTKLSKEEELLKKLLDHKEDELHDRESVEAEKNIEEMAAEWQNLRNTIGKVDKLSLDFIYGATKIDHLVEQGKKLIKDIEDIKNENVREDFKGFVVSAIKEDLNNDHEFFDKGNHNMRSNFYEFIYPIVADRLRQCFDKPITAIPQDQFEEFVKIGTYRKIPSLKELAHPAKNRKYVENTLFKLFEKQYKTASFSGKNLDEFIAWLHGGPAGGGKENPQANEILSKIKATFENYSELIDNFKIQIEKLEQIHKTGESYYENEKDFDYDNLKNLIQQIQAVEGDLFKQIEKITSNKELFEQLKKEIVNITDGTAKLSNDKKQIINSLDDETKQKLDL